MKKRIIIADAERTFREELVCAIETCEEFEIIGIAEDGNQVLQIVREQQPDILVLDSLLPQYDGITILQELQSMQNRPHILVATVFISNFVAKMFVRLGVQQLLRKPCSAERVVAHLQQMLNGQENIPAIILWEEEKTAEWLVTKMLHQISVPANIKGYRYVREAILLAAQMEMVDKTSIHHCYEEVAKVFHTTPKNVASAILCAVTKAWARGDLDTLQRVFGYTVSNTKSKPTNTEFISIVANQIRLWLKEHTDLT